MNRTSRKLFLITAYKSECQQVLPQLLTTSTTCKSKEVLSGIVVLLACIDKQIDESNKEWSLDDYSELKKCKPNILQSSSHHQSSGYYASFGNKGSFEKTSNSSVGQYCSKKYATLSKQTTINKLTTDLEQLCANELQRSVNDLNSFVPNVKSILAPVLDTTFLIQTILISKRIFHRIMVVGRVVYVLMLKLKSFTQSMTVLTP